MSTTTPAVRADARRNRDRLLSVAAEAFAAERTVSLDAIARRAGVGIGTLYRHFPTKEDLVEEVYRDEVRTLRDDATTLLASEPPAHALLQWMLRFSEWARDRRGVCEALVAMSATGRFGSGPVCDEVLQVIATLLDAGVAAGELRAGVDPVDVGALISGAMSVAGSPSQTAQLRRMLTVIVDGLAAR